MGSTRYMIIYDMHVCELQQELFARISRFTLSYSFSEFANTVHRTSNRSDNQSDRYLGFFVSLLLVWGWGATIGKM